MEQLRSRSDLASKDPRHVRFEGPGPRQPGWYLARMPSRHRSHDYRARVGIEHQVGSIQITEDLVANYHGLHQSASGVRAALPAVFSDPLAKAVPPDVLFALTWDQEIEPQLRFGDVAFLAGRRIESICDIHVGDTITGFGSLEDVFEKNRVKRTHDLRQAADPICRSTRRDRRTARDDHGPPGDGQILAVIDEPRGWRSSDRDA